MMEKDILFDITTNRKRGDWVYLASELIHTLGGADHTDCKDFIINGIRMNFTHDSNLHVSGLVRKNWAK